MHFAISKDLSEAASPATVIQAKFADSLTIHYPIKQKSCMKNSVLAEKSKDEIAQIEEALFQLAASIESGAPPAPPTPFADMMLDNNKLNAVLQEIEETEVYTPERGVANPCESEKVSAANHARRRLSKSPPPQLIKAEFHLEAPTACSVKLAADFTDWEKHPLHLIKSEDGVWFTVVPLSPGEYSYRFIVDGQWRSDPHPARCVSSQSDSGSENSVLIVP